MIPSVTLKQPLQIKTNWILKIKKGIKIIALVTLVALIVFGACFAILPPISLPTHRIYHHPSFATNQSSIIHLQNNLPSYTIAGQNIPPDFSSPTTLFHEGTSQTFEFILNNAHESIDVSSVDSINEYFAKAPLRNNNEQIVFQELISVSHPIDIIPFKLKELSFQIHYLAANIKKRKIDTIAAAAYVHQEIIRIQPYEIKNNQNDAYALLWMNFILQMGGFKAFLPSFDLHAKASMHDIKHPGSFVSYIENCIKYRRGQK